MLMRIADEPLARTLLNEPTDTRFIRNISEDLSGSAERAFSQAFVLGVHGQIEFIPTKQCSSLGHVRMDPSSHVELLDGVHRLKAVQQACLPSQQTEDLTVPVLLTEVRSNTEFASLRATLSCNRPSIPDNAKDRHLQQNLLREVAKDSIVLSVFLTRAVDLKSTALAPRSSRLFTLTAYARACRPLFNDSADLATDGAAQRLADFWEHLADLITPWRRFRDHEITAYELRRTSILGWASTLAGLALLGARLMRETPSDWRQLLEPLATFNWRKDAEIWNVIIDVEGRPAKGNQAAEAVCSVLRAARVSGRESQECTQSAPSASSLLHLRKRGTSA